MTFKHKCNAMKPVTTPSDEKNDVLKLKHFLGGIISESKTCERCDRGFYDQHLYILECTHYAHIWCLKGSHKCRKGCKTNVNLIRHAAVDRFLFPSLEIKQPPPVRYENQEVMGFFNMFRLMRCPCCRKPLNSLHGPYYLLPCCHIFHVSCLYTNVLENMRERGQKCPLCNIDIWIIHERYGNTIMAMKQQLDLEPPGEQEE